MKNKKNEPVKRQNSLHTHINCKSKMELNKKKSFDLDQKPKNGFIFQKRNSFQSNPKIVLKPIIKKNIDNLKDSKNLILTAEKKGTNFSKSGKNNQFRSGANCNLRFKYKNDFKKRLQLNCSEGKKPKSLSKKELSNLNIEENDKNNNSEYKYKDDKIEIIYNSSNNNIYASATQKGFKKKNGKEKENNQDASLIIEDVCGIKNYNIYCVMDGHGSNGHHVSNYIKEKIIQNFNNISFYFRKITNTPNIE